MTYAVVAGAIASTSGRVSQVPEVGVTAWPKTAVSSAPAEL